MCRFEFYVGVAVALALSACSGELQLGESDDVVTVDTPNGQTTSDGDASAPEVLPQEPWTPSPDGIETVDAVETPGLRRLTRSEIRYSLLDAAGLDVTALLDELPVDAGGATNFDNAVAGQSVSALEIEEYQAFAEAVGRTAAASTDFTEQLAGCTPTAADDVDCLTAVTQALGTALFRREYGDAEAAPIVDALVVYAIEDNNAATAVELVVTYFVMHPEFLYRTESPDAVDGYALANRMSFLLWGSGPDDELRGLAESGELTSEDVRRTQARRLLADPRANRQWRRFHAMWLGYEENTLPDALVDDMLSETNALVDRVVFEGGDWLDLLRADETYVTPELAEFYGLPTPTGAGWLPYDSRRGGGILSHATVLNHGHKGGNFADTSPTLRGYELYKRLTCGEFGGIPDSVDPDNPPGSASDCKVDAYSMREQPACASCHVITDGIGFGLENFGVYGEWRDEEPNGAGCTIDGAGEFGGTDFTGPAELGELLADDPSVRLCASRQLFRFALGRYETDADESAIRALANTQQHTLNLTDTLVELVASPAFVTPGGDR